MWALLFLVGSILPVGAQTALDRHVRLSAQDISLQEALDRLAAAAKLRFTYSAETLQLSRRVSPAFYDLPVGHALNALLEGSGVTAILVGGNHVVLAPRPRSGESAERPPPPVIALEQIVVTGSATGAPRRALPFALDVVEGAQLEKQNIHNLSEALSAHAPGLWLWPTATASMVSQYASVRGASSFGLTYPKIYVDGIEVANPLLFMWLSPENIERIETIRGPQGAALYGSDAISGVVNIITRSDIAAEHGRSVSVHSQGGMTASDFSADAVLTQDHAFFAALGTNTRSLGVSGGIATLGEYTPGVYARNFTLHAQTRLVGPGSSLVGTFRFLDQELGNADELLPLQIDSMRRPRAAQPTGDSATVAGPQSSRQYTIGLNAKISAGDLWTHNVVAGFDGYRLDNIANAVTPFPSQIDSALIAARGGADRGTLRLSSVASFGQADGVASSITIAGEHSRLRQSTDDRGHTIVNWRSNTGLVGQFNLAKDNRVFATAGLRLEHNSGLVTQSELAVLPMVGVAHVNNFTSSTLKLRASYGKGIRPAAAAPRVFAMPGYRPSSTQAELEPEQQAGVELGFDWLWADRFSLHLTRFDQTASGLIQQVATVTTVAGAQPYGGRRERIVHELQNVGEIENRGWELEARYEQGGLSFGATLATVDSRVDRLARGYSGDLRIGDRILGVPALTASFNGSWSGGPWLAATGFTRAHDWIGYDRARLTSAYARTTPQQSYSEFVGARLRNYWINYDGMTWWRASLSRAINERWTLSLNGENLLNHQQGEPDNITVLPGRTISLGVRARF